MQEIMQFVSRHPVLSIAWIGLLVAVLFTTFKGLTSKIKVITRGEATRLINKEDAVVVDLRQRDDFHQAILQVLSTCCQRKLKRTTLVSWRSIKLSRLLLLTALACRRRNLPTHCIKQALKT